jgi:hypothetical protein
VPEAGGFDVETDLGAERGGVGELLVATNEGEEFHLQHLTVEVFGEIEDSIISEEIEYITDSKSIHISRSTS